MGPTTTLPSRPLGHRVRELAVASLVLAVGVGLAGCGDQERPSEPPEAEKPAGWQPWRTSFHGGGADDGPAGEENRCVAGTAAASREDDATPQPSRGTAASRLNCDGTGFRDETLRVRDGAHLPKSAEPDRASDFSRRDGLAFTVEMKESEMERGALDSVHTVRALDAETRETRWSHDVRSTAVRDGDTIVGDEATRVTNRPEDGDYEDWSARSAPGGDVVGWDARTGEERWRISTPEDEWCAPTQVADRAFVTCRDDEFQGDRVTWYRWEGEGDPELRRFYRHKEAESDDALPVGIDDGDLLFLPAEGNEFPPDRRFGDLVRVDPQSGERARQHLPSKAIGTGATPYLVGGKLYFARELADHRTRLVVVGAEDGEQRWQATTSLKYASAPAVAAHRDEVYLADPAGRLVAFDGESGAKRWQTTRTPARDGGTDPGEMDARSSVTLAAEVLVVSAGDTVFSVSPDDPEAKPESEHRVKTGQARRGRAPSAVAGR